MRNESTAVVIGASRGIGAAIAAELVTRGWYVIGVARTRPSEWDGQLFIEGDIASSDSLVALCEALSSVSTIDALVNCAAISIADSVGTAYHEAMSQAFAVNVIAPAILLRNLVDVMKPGSMVLNIGSIVARGRKSRMTYAASKAALESLTRTWAAELAPAGISCNMISPGPTRTETFVLANPPESVGMQELQKRLPTGRINETSDVAEVAVAILSVKTRQMTGQVITVDGGLTATAF